MTAMSIKNPALHFAALGGHAGAIEAYGFEHAHRLWDTARLWTRDQEDPRLAARWLLDYRRRLARALEPEPIPVPRIIVAPRLEPLVLSPRVLAPPVNPKPFDHRPPRTAPARVHGSLADEAPAC
jgi:hypothetical protein